MGAQRYMPEGATAWRKAAVVALPAVLAVGALAAGMAQGALAASFAVSGTSFCRRDVRPAVRSRSRCRSYCWRVW
ncbi:hypothetical protein [Streptomyces silvisoli]|uniref:Uncharacterized protein n=1 Tax=Streptomyces silvisoli TaxID=3034235 RepID=A0ABT5ZV78_9ACTN|nr:hypothetical protein [Streptomyces silvisoli]MDF3293731.1 hypothetical protein [Streptomyces silvisoli]